MRTVTCKVTSGGEQVAIIDVEQFDGIEEAAEFFANDGGIVEVLSLTNAMHKINCTNKARQANVDNSKAAAFAKLGRKIAKMSPAEQLAALSELTGIKLADADAE